MAPTEEKEKNIAPARASVPGKVSLQAPAPLVVALTLANDSLSHKV